MTSEKLFQVQERLAITRPRLRNYIESMPTAVLSNVCTFIGLVNGAKYISVSIVPDNDGINS